MTIFLDLTSASARHFQKLDYEIQTNYLRNNLQDCLEYSDTASQRDNQ